MFRCFPLISVLVGVPAVIVAQGNVPATSRGRVPSQPYAAYTVVDPLGRTIEWYLSESRGASPRPLIVYIHGSGHQSLFRQADGRIAPANGHATVVDVAADLARVLIVEKPGVARFEAGDGPPSAAFRREHTLERWVEAVATAILAARRLPGVDTTRLLVVGHSEGGLVAARVAARLPQVSHVALLAGGGPTQLFDLLQLARAGTFFAEVSPDPAARVAYVLAQWDSITADPESATRDFFGHPFRRWASFLRDSPIAALRETKAAVFLAQGEADQAVTRESFEALLAELVVAGKQPTARVIAGADHSFVVHRPGAAPRDGWTDVLRDVVRWYLR